MICSTVVGFIYNLHGHKITEYNQNILDPASLQIYVDAAFAKGATLDNCFGFVDGTVRPICRPQGSNNRNVRLYLSHYLPCEK